MGITVDIIALLFLAYFVYKGRKVGFVASLISSLSFLIALLISALFCTPLANALMDTSVGQSLSGSISGTITSSIAATPDATIGEIHIPQVFLQNLSESQPVMDTAEKIADNIATGILCVVIFILLFIATKIIIHLAAKPLSLITSVPVIKQVNNIAGATLGLVSGFMWIYTVVALLGVLSFIPSIEGIAKIMNQSYLVSFLYNHNIIIHLLA